jgi:hypothetical protein
MKLISEATQHDIKLINEEKDGRKNYFIEGTFMQAEVPNRNGRIYPNEVLMSEVARYNTERILSKTSLGELGHPEGPQINMDRVSHMITELRVDGDNVWGRAKIMDTPFGKIVKTFIDEGVKLGVSSRGLGSLRPKGDIMEVQGDFWLSTIDIVSDPSAPEAFVNGIMENKEWVFVDGRIKEKDIEAARKEIIKTSKYGLDEASIKVYQDFLKKLGLIA